LRDEGRGIFDQFDKKFFQEIIKMKKINYQLREGVYVIHQGEDFYLLSEIPLIVIKVNEVLYYILCEMRRSSFLSCLPEKDHPLIGLLERVVTKGLLIKDEVIETPTYRSISVRRVKRNVYALFQSVIVTS
jgi:hypothetical protein